MGIDWIFIYNKSRSTFRKHDIRAEFLNQEDPNLWVEHDKTTHKIHFLSNFSQIFTFIFQNWETDLLKLFKLNNLRCNILLWDACS